MKRVTSSMNPNAPRRRPLAIPVVAGLFTLASTLGGAAGPVFAACPSSQALRNFKAASNVAADFSTDSSNVTTYRFSSLTNENPVNGVPGLIEYCVYPSPAQRPTEIDPQATGADGSDWITRQRRGSPPWLTNRQPPPGNAGFGNFSFVRPRGNPTNIPLDGKSTVVGTATWSTVPTAQTILLHIADPTVCASIYRGTERTCFVKPSLESACVIGDTTVAYNAMPFGVVNCSKSSWGFEATSTSEFGDEVELAGTATELESLNVLFASYACSSSGHWYTGDCNTTVATFTHPITARIYEVLDCSGTPCPGNKIAEVTQDFDIPYRPSAEPQNCPAAADGAAAGSQWFNPLANGGTGACQHSISTVLKFTLPGTLPDNRKVIWTVAFDTTHYGESPIGQGATCFGTSAGCPYDSLNVGVKAFPGAPYAGTDVDPKGAFLSSTWGGAYCDGGAGGTGLLRLDTDTPCWDGYTPLGEIITK